jgi:hypothetical protein
MDYGRLVAEMPMQVFKDGIKRLRVVGAPGSLGEAPFEVLSRETDGLSDAETWVVRGWESPMQKYLEGLGASLRETVDLDLEEGFVELLRTARISSEGST